MLRWCFQVWQVNCTDFEFALPSPRHYPSLPERITNLQSRSTTHKQVVIIGGGPAGLTAALELSKQNVPAVVLEADKQVGGIARTVNYKGYLFDIGGHRFFTKWDEVNQIWNDVLGDKCIERQRLSRIYYKKKFFRYPLVAKNALFGLGLFESLRILGSYAKAKLRPTPKEENLEEWVCNRFG